MTNLDLAASPFTLLGIRVSFGKEIVSATLHTGNLRYPNRPKELSKNGLEPTFTGLWRIGRDIEKYCQKKATLIDGTVSMRPWLSVVQDNAPHAAARTMEQMGERVVTPVSWPPNSSDLKLLETVWDNMKDYMQLKYPSLSS